MTPKEKILAAAEEAEEDGFERDDGRWVDPPLVQKVAIEVGFKQAADDQQFDVWSVVNPKVAIREDNTLAENFGRVYDQYENVAERPELKERLVELQEQYGQDGE